MVSIFGRRFVHKQNTTIKVTIKVIIMIRGDEKSVTFGFESLALLSLTFSNDRI